MSDNQPRFLVVSFAVTVFLSAFLLFQVQPLLSKAILPWFGGTPAVWTTCMLFFQTLLFGGYAYAHLLAKRLSPLTQMVLHLVLIIAAASTLPIAPDAEMKPDGSEDPIIDILAVLSLSVGLPFFILSSTGPLLQAWFAQARPGSSPYRLYALSNAGSLLALVTYPFVFEPVLDVGEQSFFWSTAFALFALLCAWCARMTYQSRQAYGAHTKADGSHPVGSAEQKNLDTSHTEHTPITPAVVGLWFLLAMCGSMLLLATTNQVCLDVAAIPFLWVMPLALYLLTFILCFDSDRWYSRYWAIPAMIASLYFMGTMIVEGSGNSLLKEIAWYFGGMFCCTMVCHGELVRLKPAPTHLTAFYLVISAGGAAGGMFVGIVAPIVFPVYLELHVALCSVSLLAIFVVFRESGWLLKLGRPYWAAALLASLAGFYFQGRYLYTDIESEVRRTVEISRNFYGVLRVYEHNADNPDQHSRSLLHGRIQHGMQYLAKDKRRLPTTYYGRQSAVGLVLENHYPGKPKHVGVVGLGVGTIASYAKPGDRYRFYEINPEVVRLAESHFYYLSDCRGAKEVIIGDARLMLERERPQNFDVLILDAFSSDAIPAHLLTMQAFEAYTRHLKPDGVLVVHVSNLYFNLYPVVSAAADGVGLKGRIVVSDGDDSAGVSVANWMVFARNMNVPGLSAVRKAGEEIPERRIEWTDTFSNLLQVLKKR